MPSIPLILGQLGCDPKYLALITISKLGKLIFIVLHRHHHEPLLQQPQHHYYQYCCYW
jgi:hypothetical protein